MGPTACSLVAGLIDWIEGPRSDHGHPRCPTEGVVETLRFFLREGVQWRELRTTGKSGLRHDAAPAFEGMERGSLLLPRAYYDFKSSGTLPPLSASFCMTCLCSQMFIAAELFISPL